MERAAVSSAGRVALDNIPNRAAPPKAPQQFCPLPARESGEVCLSPAGESGT